MATRQKLPKEAWQTIDPASLSPTFKTAYDAYKAAYAKATTAREAFDDLMNVDAEKRKLVPTGKRLIVSHKFGKLTVAIGDASTAPSGAVAWGSLHVA